MSDIVPKFVVAAADLYDDIQVEKRYNAQRMRAVSLVAILAVCIACFVAIKVLDNFFDDVWEYWNIAL